MRTIVARAALAFAVAIGMMTAAPRTAVAADHLTGVVLAAPGDGTALIHHQSFSGMPAMTMNFRLPRGTVVHSGDRISADVNTKSDPWSLRNVRTNGTELPPKGSKAPAFVKAGEPVPHASFVDARARPFSLDSLRGAPYAMTFIYTRCTDPTMCPFVSGKFESVQRRLSGAHATLVEVSLDPAYDRPDVLARYGKQFGADPSRWHLLTGDPKTVLDFAGRFGILEKSAGPVTIIHSERLAIVDSRGRIVQLFDGARWQPDDVRRALAAAR